MKVATAVLVVLLFELVMAWSTYAATVFLVISDAGWIAIPLIITAILTPLIGVATLILNYKLTKNNKDTEAIKTTVSTVVEKVEDVKKEQNDLAVKTEQLHTTINSGLTVRLEKEKAIGRFEGKEELQKTHDAEKKGAQDERARGAKEIKDVEIKGKMKINPNDIK